MTLAVLSVVVVQGFGRFTFPLLLPAMAAELLGSYSVAGWSATANLGAYFLGVLIMSATAARLGSFAQLKIGMVLTVFGMGALALATSFAIVVLGMLLTGLASAFVWVPATGVVAAVVAPGRRGFALGMQATGAGIGIVIASPLTATVRNVADNQDAWRPVWWLEAGIGLVVLVALLVLLKPVPTRVAPRPGLTALRSVPRWRFIAVAYMSFGVSFTLYSVFIVSALEDDAGLSPGGATRLYTLLGAASMVGGVALAKLSDFVGRRLVLFGCGAAMVVCPLLIPIGRQPWLTISVIGFGLVLTGFGAVGAVLVSDHVQSSEIGATLGAIVIALGVGQFIAPPIGGRLADVTGSFNATFALAAAFGLVCAGASAWVIERDTDHGD